MSNAGILYEVGESGRCAAYHETSPRHRPAAGAVDSHRLSAPLRREGLLTNLYQAAACPLVRDVVRLRLLSPRRPVPDGPIVPTDAARRLHF